MYLLWRNKVDFSILIKFLVVIHITVDDRDRTVSKSCWYISEVLTVAAFMNSHQSSPPKPSSILVPAGQSALIASS